MSRTALSMLVLLLLLPGGCGVPPERRQVEAEIPFGRFWREFEAAALISGYRPDTAATDSGLRVFVSRWNEQPAPFGLSRRTRLHGRFVQPDDAPDNWRCEFWIERQTVEDISKGFHPAERDWSRDGQAVDREEILLAQLRARLGQEHGIVPTFERYERHR